MKELLAFLGFTGYQEVESYIKSIQLPQGEKNYLSQSIGVCDTCLVLYLMIIEEVEITEVDNTKLLVTHNFAQDVKFSELQSYSLGLYDLFSKSSQSGFIIIRNTENCLREYISHKKKKAWTFRSSFLIILKILLKVDIHIFHHLNV